MDIKTFDSSKDGLDLDPIYKKQKEGVAKMRTSLLAYTEDNGFSVRDAIKNVTAMRVYHQLLRIVKYLEMMDKLETKLYESINYSIDSSNSADPLTWMTLLQIQEKVQKSMIESHKLLQPYLDIQEFIDLDTAHALDADSTATVLFLNPDVRDKLRTNAQLVLEELSTG